MRFNEALSASSGRNKETNTGQIHLCAGVNGIVNDEPFVVGGLCLAMVLTVRKRQEEAKVDIKYSY